MRPVQHRLDLVMGKQAAAFEQAQGPLAHRLLNLLDVLKMLRAGTLSKPIDIFDFLLHLAPWLLLAAKLVSLALQTA